MWEGSLMFLTLRQAQDDINGGGCLMFLTLRQAQDDINGGGCFNVFNPSTGSG